MAKTPEKVKQCIEQLMNNAGAEAEGSRWGTVVIAGVLEERITIIELQSECQPDADESNLRNFW